jgi:Uma2 family endonuclease
MRLNRFLSRALDDDLALSTAGPIPIRPWSQPEPDFAIVDAADVTFHAHPERTHLVIEVADSSLRKDQITKAEIYGKAGFPEYWIVDVKAAAVHVHRRPSPAGYRHLETVRPPERLVPFDIELALPPLDLAVLFAPGPSQP